MTPPSTRRLAPGRGFRTTTELSRSQGELERSARPDAPDWRHVGIIVGRDKSIYSDIGENRRLRPPARRSARHRGCLPAVVERHWDASTLVTLNLEPIERIGKMVDALLAQSAIDVSSRPPTSSSSTASPTVSTKSRARRRHHDTVGHPAATVMTALCVSGHHRQADAADPRLLPLYVDASVVPSARATRGSPPRSGTCHAGLHRRVRDHHGPVGVGKTMIAQASSD